MYSTFTCYSNGMCFPSFDIFWHSKLKNVHNILFMVATGEVESAKNAHDDTYVYAHSGNRLRSEKKNEKHTKSDKIENTFFSLVNIKRSFSSVYFQK